MGNLYNSILETFNAFRLYSKVLPVTPPADLSLPNSLFTTKFAASRLVSVGGVPQIGYGTSFDRTDKPRLRSVGFFANIADGLVDAETPSTAVNTLYNIGLALERYGVMLTGTISNTAGTDAIVGVGTLFTNELAPGMIIVWEDDEYNIRQGEIDTITDDLNLVLTAVTDNTANSMFENADTTAKRAYPKIANASIPGDAFDGEVVVNVATLNQLYAQDVFIGDVSFVRPIEGRISFQNAIAGGANTVATGLGTKFTRDVIPGQWIRYTDDASVIKTVLVLTVDSDTQLTIVTPAAGVAGVATVATRVIVGTSGWMDSFLAVRVQIYSNPVFSTITIDPSFDAKQFSLHIISEIEHTLPMIGSMQT